MFKSMQPKDWVKLCLHGTLSNTDFDMSIGNFTHTVYKYTNVIACNNERPKNRKILEIFKDFYRRKNSIFIETFLYCVVYPETF